MKTLTLREIQEELGVSRRAIQGYEDAHLVKASGKNERGYLLYNEVEIKRILHIKQLQRFGFKIKEIAIIIDAPNDVKKAALERRAVAMEFDLEGRNQTMQEIRELIATL